MDHGILSIGVENGGHWHWPSKSRWPFDSKFEKIRIVRTITCNGFHYHQICTKYASWHTIGWYWKWGSLTLTLKVILTQNSRKRHPTLLLYTDLGQPSGVTRPTCSCHSTSVLHATLRLLHWSNLPVIACYITGHFVYIGNKLAYPYRLYITY